MRLPMTARCYAFGPFHVDVAKRQLTRDAVAVPLTPKVFDILVLLLQHRGEVVEKDDLVREIWRGQVVEENNIARHISTLRKALDDGPHRWIATIPGRGYQFTGDVQELAAPSDSGGADVSQPADAHQPPVEPRTEVRPPATAAPSLRSWRSAVVIGGALAATLAAVYIGSARGSSGRETSPAGPLWQLTFSSGWHGEPTWSPDGRMIAFSSNRAGNLDIWVQTVDGGDPVQVTKSPEHDWQADWSSDGQLVFRSERAGGGLFVAPALGGAEQQVASFGYQPHWAPDGSQILFHRSNFQGRVLTSRELYTVGRNGEPPRPVLADFLRHVTTFSAAWHPDSRRVSIWGLHVREGLTFWTIPLAGGMPVKSSMTDAVRKSFAETGVRFTDAEDLPLQFVWSPDGDALYFEGTSRGVRNMWRVAVDPATLEWRSGPARLTTSADLHEGIALSADGRKMALAIRNERTRLWAFRIDPTGGRLLDEGAAITGDTVDALAPVLSRDGTRLLYETERGDNQELWVRSLLDGRDTLLIGGSRYRRASPIWSFDDRHIVYLRTLPGADGTTDSDREVLTIPSAGGSEQQLRTHAPVARLLDWSPDGTWLLAALQPRTGGRYELALVRTDGRGDEVRVIATDPHSNLWKARFSSDGQWVAYVAVTGPGVSAIQVVRTTGGAPIQITGSDKTYDDRPRWSPDGRIVYFLSTRSGFLNMWARRFDPVEQKTIGDAFPVTHFDSPARMIPPRMVQLGVAMSRDRVILPIREASGNIWILEGVSD
jgi:Tol biopolymer transport system component/DNA-binding winged helix-turn-helix (wHTH) protein